MSADEVLDVLIVGGGPAGACAGALLTRASVQKPLRVAILEPRRPALPPPGAPMDSRVVAISRASERILGVAGAWDGVIGPRLCAYERMCVWHESVSTAEALRFDAAD